MIDQITFKAGPSPGAPGLVLDVAPITVFVGPNNAGKSQVLVELETLNPTSKSVVSKLLAGLVFSPVSSQEFAVELEALKDRSTVNQSQTPGGLHLTRNGRAQGFNGLQNTIQFMTDVLFDQVQSGNLSGHYMKILRLLTIRLDGKNRLTLLNEQPMGDLMKAPQNPLALLFVNNELREKVRSIVLDAFGSWFVIDPTNGGKLRVRLAKRAPVNESEERGLDTAAVDYHSQNTLIDETSDGVRAFTGIITALIADDPKITLIDEPEAFLHPALAMKLGKEVAAISANDPKKRLFVSTHSAAFLMGCIQSGAPLNIVRLTYKSGVATTRVLRKEQLLPLMRKPLLRSTGMLEGLFYEAVIVSEGNSDRAFYQEINERLRTVKDERGLGNCLFINTEGKDTIWDVVRPLRELGIPAVGIVDVDVLKKGGTEFRKLTGGAFFSDIALPGLEITRLKVLAALEATGTAWKTNGGLAVLPVNEQQGANDFFNQLEDYGVFVVRSGEVEAWLSHLNVPKSKPNWLPQMFERMGEDPADAAYVQPAPGDVWDFMGRIRQWVDNPNRKGIPA